jgi:ankyrin repeat protein
MSCVSLSFPDIDQIYCRGNSPLHLASESGYSEILELLLSLETAKENVFERNKKKVCLPSHPMLYTLPELFTEIFVHVPLVDCSALVCIQRTHG